MDKPRAATQTSAGASIGFRWLRWLVVRSVNGGSAEQVAAQRGTETQCDAVAVQLT
jgi:hypothetical protein